MADSYIWNGLWYDYESRTYVITLSGGKAGALAAAIPIAVTFAGAQTWNLWRTWLYSHYESQRTQHLSGPQDQRRLLIRNSAGGLPLSLDLIRWKLTWRKSIPGRIGRPLPWPVIAFVIGLFHFAFWIVAGVLTGFIFAQPYVTSAGLATGSDCGFIVTNDTASVQQQLLYEAYDVNTTIGADQYVKQCWITFPSPTAPCSFLPQRRIEYTEYDVACPFESNDLCLGNLSTPFSIDSGYIRSNTDLGINAKDSDSVLFRKNTTCSPIHSGGFTSIVDAADTADPSVWPPGSQVYRFFFGPIGGTGPQASAWTYEFNDWKPSDGTSYDLNGFPFFTSRGAQAWTPNATFWNATSILADVGLFFLNGDHTEYAKQTNDPFFMANVTLERTVNGVTQIVYVPTYYVNVLACLDSYQICPADKSEQHCTAPGGITTTSLRSQFLGLNAMQAASAQRIINQQSFLSTYYAVQSRGAAGLLASLGLVDDLETQNLPNDQWRKEVAHWFSISLAKLQQAFVAYATGPATPELVAHTQKPTGLLAQQLQAQCHMQKVIIPAGTLNFNFNVIIALLITGVPLWLVGTCSEWIMNRYWGLRRDPKRWQWVLDAPCQLQRLAYTAAGYGRWTEATLASGTPVWTGHPKSEWPKMDWNLKVLALISASSMNSAPASTGSQASSGIPSTSPLRPPSQAATATAAGQLPMSQASTGLVQAMPAAPPPSSPPSPPQNPPHGQTLSSASGALAAPVVPLAQVISSTAAPQSTTAPSIAAQSTLQAPTTGSAPSTAQPTTSGVPVTASTQSTAASLLTSTAPVIQHQPPTSGAVPNTAAPTGTT